MFLCGLLDPWLATGTESVKVGRMNGIVLEFRDIQAGGPPRQIGASCQNVNVNVNVCVYSLISP